MSCHLIYSKVFTLNLLVSIFTSSKANNEEAFMSYRGKAFILASIGCVVIWIAIIGFLTFI